MRCCACSSNFKTQRQHILDLLMAAEGAEVPLADIMVCAAQYNACIHALRKRGYKIVNRSETRNGVKHSWYRLESSPTDLTPRTPEPAPSRKKSSQAQPLPSSAPATFTPQSIEPAQTLSLFPEMPAPAPQRSAWRDPELDGLKNGACAMAEKGRPWMRWHVTRWRNSPRVLQMPLAAQGAYRNLLDAAWQQGGRLPNLPAVLWKYALAQSPEEFAAVAAQVLAMFTVSECGNWLSNETLMEECADRTTFADELSRKRSEAGKRGSAPAGLTMAKGRWQTGWQKL